MYWHKHTLPPYEWRKQPEVDACRAARMRWLIILALGGSAVLCCGSLVLVFYLLLR